MNSALWVCLLKFHRYQLSLRSVELPCLIFICIYFTMNGMTNTKMNQWEWKKRTYFFEIPTNARNHISMQIFVNISFPSLEIGQKYGIISILTHSNLSIEHCSVNKSFQPIFGKMMNWKKKFHVSSETACLHKLFVFVCIVSPSSRKLNWIWSFSPWFYGQSTHFFFSFSFSFAFPFVQ